jgi:hypothetical protein
MSTSGFHAENVLTAGMLLLPMQKEEYRARPYSLKSSS